MVGNDLAQLSIFLNPSRCNRLLRGDRVLLQGRPWKPLFWPNSYTTQFALDVGENPGVSLLCLSPIEIFVHRLAGRDKIDSQKGSDIAYSVDQSLFMLLGTRPPGLVPKKRGVNLYGGRRFTIQLIL